MKKSNTRKAGQDYEKNRSPERIRMLEQLKDYTSNGCQLSLCGKASYPQAIVNAYFREDSTYMPDYIADEEDVIRQIDFTRIGKS